MSLSRAFKEVKSILVWVNILNVPFEVADFVFPFCELGFRGLGGGKQIPIDILLLANAVPFCTPHGSLRRDQINLNLYTSLSISAQLSPGSRLEIWRIQNPNE
jgi:hypothetical protein